MLPAGQERMAGYPIRRLLSVAKCSVNAWMRGLRTWCRFDMWHVTAPATWTMHALTGDMYWHHIADTHVLAMHGFKIEKSKCRGKDNITLSLPLSLSLSHTHTHTHIHKYMYVIHRVQPPPMCTCTWICSVHVQCHVSIYIGWSRSMSNTLVDY